MARDLTTVRAATTAAVAVAAGLANGAPGPCAARPASEHAMAAQTIAGTDDHGRILPAGGRGRDPLFGKVVTGRAWMLGANWATTVDVDHDVRANGSSSPRGSTRCGRWCNRTGGDGELRRQWHKFHAPLPTDSSDVQLRLTVCLTADPPLSCSRGRAPGGDD